MAPTDDPAPIFRFGEFEADLGARELRRSGKLLPLPGKPFAVLAALLERSGQPVTREELRQRLWPDGTHVDFDNNLNSAVTRLRAALGDPAGRSHWIETLPRRGYRFREGAVLSPAPAGRAGRVARIAGATGLPAAALVAVTLALSAAAPRPAPVPEAARAAFDRGVFLSRDLRPGSAARAVSELERAARLAPGWAAAHGAHAEALVHRAMAGRGAHAALDRAEAAAGRARGLDPQDAAAHRALSGVRLLQDWDVAAAIGLAERALELDPDTAAGHMVLAGAQCAAGRFDDAVASARRAARLDPASWLVRSDLGFFLMAAGRHAEAESEARAALELVPDFEPARGFLASALAARGRARAALEALGVEVTSDDPAAALSRHWRRRLERLEELPATIPGLALARARAHARLGEAEAALEWLEESRRAREPVLVFLDAFPEFGDLRRDPRFDRLRRRVLGSPPPRG